MKKKGSVISVAALVIVLNIVSGATYGVCATGSLGRIAVWFYTHWGKAVAFNEKDQLYKDDPGTLGLAIR
jgi:hypothetical protein